MEALRILSENPEVDSVIKIRKSLHDRMIIKDQLLVFSGTQFKIDQSETGDQNRSID